MLSSQIELLSHILFNCLQSHYTYPNAVCIDREMDTRHQVHSLTITRLSLESLSQLLLCMNAISNWRLLSLFMPPSISTSTYIFKGHVQITTVGQQAESSSTWMQGGLVMPYHTHKESTPGERLPSHLPDEPDQSQGHNLLHSDIPYH